MNGPGPSSGLVALVVGTPRSGTTLLRIMLEDRLGLQVPAETHFFSHLLEQLTEAGHELPLRGSALERALEMFAATPQLGGVDVDLERARNTAGDPPVGVPQLFLACLAALGATGPAIGEKTPEHLWYSDLVMSAFPDTKTIVVVRDPRSVVASTSRVPWGGQGPVWWASRWRDDQEIVLALMQSSSWAARVRTIRYEDLVADPDATVEALGHFLDLPLVAGRPEPGKHPIPSRTDLDAPEMKRALEPPDPTRAQAWAAELDPGWVAVIDAVCGEVMVEFDYRTAVSDDPAGSAAMAGDELRAWSDAVEDMRATRARRRALVAQHLSTAPGASSSRSSS